MKILCPVLPILLVLIFLVGCGSQNGNNSQPPPPPPPPTQFAISGTLANLAAGSNGVVLQNNGGDNISLTANGTFLFATKITSGSAYDVTSMTQPSSPVQRCSVANGGGKASANVSNVRVECGHNEWAWMAGSQNINQIGTYGTLGSPASANTPGGRQFPATWTDKSGSFWLFGGYGYDSNGTLMPMSDLWEYSAGEWTWRGAQCSPGKAETTVPWGLPPQAVSRERDFNLPVGMMHPAVSGCLVETVLTRSAMNLR